MTTNTKGKRVKEMSMKSKFSNGKKTVVQKECKN